MQQEASLFVVVTDYEHGPALLLRILRMGEGQARMLEPAIVNKDLPLLESPFAAAQYCATRQGEELSELVERQGLECLCSPEGESHWYFLLRMTVADMTESIRSSAVCVPLTEILAITSGDAQETKHLGSLELCLGAVDLRVIQNHLAPLFCEVGTAT